MSNLTHNVIAFLAPFAKGYANARTLAKFLAGFNAALDANGLRGNLDVVTLPSGRLQPVLVFGAREAVGPEAVMLAHRGLPVYQHRKDGQPRANA